MCSKSVEQYPGNRMLGWRIFVDGKVEYKLVVSDKFYKGFDW